MHRNKLACSILVLAVAGSMWACGSDDDSTGGGAGSGGRAGSAGSSGRAGSAGSSHAGTAGKAEGGSSGAPEGGAPEAGTGAGGSDAGAGGDSAGGMGGDMSGAGMGGEAGSGAPPAPTLAENCAAVCAAQAALTCSYGATCVQSCISGATDTSFTAEYTAMIACEASKLVATDYECSDQGTSIDPAPKKDDTKCEPVICKWTCDDQTFVNVNIYDRCGCS